MPNRRPAVIAAVAAVVVVVLAVVVTTILLNNRGSGAIDGGSEALTTTAVATTSARPTTTTPPPTSTTVRIPPDDVITVASGVDHPATVAARSTLRTYIVGINESDYQDAFNAFTTDSDTYRGGLDTWAEGQETTSIGNAMITAVRDVDLETIEVDMSFTSFQAPEYGPDGQTCTDWQLAYEMVGSGPDWLIRKATPIVAPVGC